MLKVLLKHDSSPKATEVELQRVSAAPDGVLVARYGDARCEVGVEEREDGGVLHIHGRVLPFHAFATREQVDVWIAGNTYRFHVEEKRPAARAGAPAGAAARATDEISAPMPGTVLKIDVAAGDSFQAHQPLLVLESMKMEMALSAPAAGRVREVLCRPGELVQMGQVLLKLGVPE